MTYFAVDPGIRDTTVTIHLDGAMHATARTIGSIARAAGAREVHVDARGIGNAFADVLLTEMRGAATIFKHYDGKELPR